ncbi:MAG: endonuclease III domain-containing protein [Planctomycetales bacterium]|nr:endonuclease III domain-containing protein [Planctomycetales bacterium]
MRVHAAQVYEILLDKLGPQGWWPGDTPLEVMIGAVLVQNTAWANVERALDNLRNADALDPHRLLALSPAELEPLIRPAGYFRVKSRRLQNLMRWLVDRAEGDAERLRESNAQALREELLAINGVGPETADSILLYALEKPVLVVDAYTLRIWARHGWIDYDVDYHQLQEHLASELPQEVGVFNELHALLVAVGKKWCKPKPHCAGCPLEQLLPESGIAEPCW